MAETASTLYFPHSALHSSQTLFVQTHPAKLLNRVSLAGNSVTPSMTVGLSPAGAIRPVFCLLVALASLAHLPRDAQAMEDCMALGHCLKMCLSGKGDMMMSGGLGSAGWGTT